MHVHRPIFGTHCFCGNSSTKHCMIRLHHAVQGRILVSSDCVFGCILSLAGKKGGIHLQRLVTTLWASWQAVEGKWLISVSITFFCIRLSKNWRYWCCLTVFAGTVQNISLLVSVCVWTAVPKMWQGPRVGRYFCLLCFVKLQWRLLKKVWFYVNNLNIASPHPASIFFSSFRIVVFVCVFHAQSTNTNTLTYTHTHARTDARTHTHTHARAQACLTIVQVWLGLAYSENPFLTFPRT